MIRVKLSTKAQGMPLIRFTPGSKAVWGNCQFFYMDDEVKEVDWWIVMEGLAKTEQVACPPENTILIAQENEFMKNYNQKFVNQFAKVVTCHKTMKHPHKILTQQVHPSPFLWARTGRGYDELKAITEIPKTKLMSVVASHKVRTEGQILRNRFINKMKEHFGNKLDCWSNRPGTFGPDTLIEKDSKWNNIAPYKYYLSIENSSVPHYWTSNLGDAYLAGAYPFYYGHPSVYEYFSKDALTMIDIADIPSSIATIEKVIADNYFEKRQKEIWKARDLVLEKYQIFPMLTDLIQSLPSSKTPKLITLCPEAQPALIPSLAKTLKRFSVVHTLAKKAYRQYRTLRYKQKYGE